MENVNIRAGGLDSEIELERQRETFITSVSHDLKNPTIALMRVVELLLKGNFGKVEPAQREVMQTMLESIKYMYSMLGSFLTTYRNERGTIKLANDEVSVFDLAKECIDEMIYLAKDKDIKIFVKNFAENDIIYGDRIQIKRVIMNLISNGIKYAYRETNLNVEVYNDGKNTCFRFENQSPYLTPEKQQKIFARYVTFMQTDMSSGTGLGLYASKKIVEAHGGEIFVKSFIENKNLFGFKIPNNLNLANQERFVTF